MSDQEEEVVSGEEVDNEEVDNESEDEEEVDEDAPVMSKRKQRKLRFGLKLIKILAEYKNVMIVTIDNVGSNQMQKVRIALRGKAEMLMGKNTIVRKIIRENLDKYPGMINLLPFITGNVGFVFSNGDMAEMRKIVTESKVPAGAKTGALAPVDVYVEPGATGLDPGQTAFFQALNIGTKIARGSIEIINRVHLIKKGDKVTASAVALLSKLNVKPFFYGIVCTQVYEDGGMYAADILDLSDDDLLRSFFSGVRNVAALSMALNHPTAASLPHLMINGFKNLVAVALETEWMFEEAKKYKEMIDNPSAGGGGDDDDDEEEEEEEESSEEEESDGNVGGGLFE
jgi:large subunit ribosomal protein LP0